ncbi:MAG: hypothetical protein IPJ76_04775 [Flavobacteriales bacterium]|nr:MAG: hypothetical protein IPJ76_04775 [Flavobacteriales bacterium]
MEFGEPVPTDPTEYRTWVITYRDERIRDIQFAGTSGQAFERAPVAWQVEQDYIVQFCDQEVGRLDRLAAAVFVSGMPSAPPFTWKGEAGELFQLFDEMIGKGWIRIPRNGGKVSRTELAKRVRTAFDFDDGSTIAESVAVKYLKKSKYPPGQTVQTLDWNPKVPPGKRSTFNPEEQGG